MAVFVDQEDYYFGAALLAFFNMNEGAKPALIEALSDTRSYRILTDGNKYVCLYMKHSENPRVSPKDNSLAWTFNITDNDKCNIQKHIEKHEKTFIVLVCSEKPFTNTQFAVIKQEEYLLLSHKKSITIKWEMASKQRKQSFTIPNQGGMPIPPIRCDRLLRKITEI